MLEMTGKKPMNRTYTANSPYSLSPTERIRSYPEEPGYEAGYSNQDGYQNGYRGHEPGAYETQPEYPGLQEPEDFDEYLQKYEEQKTDRRWMWVAGIAGVILFIAIGTTNLLATSDQRGGRALRLTSTFYLGSVAALVFPALLGFALEEWGGRSVFVVSATLVAGFVIAVVVLARKWTRASLREGGELR